MVAPHIVPLVCLSTLLKRAGETVNSNEEIRQNLELLRQEVLKKTEPQNMGAPELISIERDDYHAMHIGCTENGLQFFLTNLFIPAISGNLGNEFFGVFLFNEEGDLVQSNVDELGPRSQLDDKKVEALWAKRLAELGKMQYCDIKVKPFAVEHFGILMGLVPFKFHSSEGHGEYWLVDLHPGGCMAFTAPWDSGGYDT
jgi:hypothetical protein